MYLQIMEYVFYTICNHSKDNKRYERGVENAVKVHGVEDE